MSGTAPHLDDEKLSELLDGGGTTAEMDHAASCPECGTRLDAWRDAVRAISNPLLVQESHREQAIAAALSQFDAGSGTSDVPVVDLAKRRKRRRAALGMRVAAAAAAVAAIGGVSAVVIQSGGTTNHAASTAAPNTKASSANGVSGGASQGALAPSSSPTVLNLGEIDGNGQLVAALTAPRITPTYGGVAPSSPSPSAPASTSCPGRPNVSGSLEAEATLQWKGTPAIALVYKNGQGHTAVVEASDTCDVLTTVSY
jgi:anti-sigma factor RsiW